MKVIDGGEGEDVNKGEGVNVKDLGDGEADIGDDGDNNKGDFFCPPSFQGHNVTPQRKKTAKNVIIITRSYPHLPTINSQHILRPTYANP